MQFDGAKVALFLGDALLVMRRDARLDVTWAGAMDWPGGGADPGETPEDTVLRETVEEVGLRLDPSDLQGKVMTDRLGVRVVKFVARLKAERVKEVKLGDEGQDWGLMSAAEFAAHVDAVPSLVAFLRQDIGLGWPDKDSKVACRTPTKDRDGVTHIPTWKFNLMRGWLRELARRGGSEGVPFQGLSAQIASLMHEGDAARLGSVGWHMTTVKLELEVRQELSRAPGKGPQRIIAGPKFLETVTGGV